ncbi:MAG: hypothetical protein JRI25_11385 [Deltaproteobacteria bacterium]|nr:hypothetical protein [Deltaproteobacteria bacterium]
MEAPGGGGTGGGPGQDVGESPGEGEEGTGEDAGGADVDVDIEEILDTNADDSVVAALSEEAAPWYNHPIVRGGENIIERLIPIYGFYDSFRDAWNRHGDMVEMAPPFLESPGSAIMHVSMTIANIASGLSGIVRHLGYIVSICQWLLTFSAVADGPVGPILAVIAGIGGEICNIIALICEAVSAAFNLITVVTALISAACTDDETNRLRYLNVAAMGTENFFGNIVNGVMDVIALASWNFIPSGATSEAVRALLGGVIRTGARFLIQGAVRWGIHGVGEEMTDFELGRLPVDEEGNPVRTYEWPHMSRGLFREGWGWWGMSEDEGPGMTGSQMAEASPTPSSEATATLVPSLLTEDSRATGGANPAGGGIPMPEVDFSPAQVAALSTMSADLHQILAGSQESQGELETHRGVHQENVALTEQADADVTSQLAAREGMLAPLAEAQANLEGGSSNSEEAQGHLEELQSQTNTVGEQTGRVGEIQMPDPPPQEDAGLLERAVNWLSQQAMNAAFSRAEGMIGNAQGEAGTQGAAAGAASGEAGSTLGGLATFMGQLQEAMGLNSQTEGETQSAIGQLTNQQGQVQEARAASTEQVAAADEAIAEEGDAQEQITDLIERVDAERERQEQEIAAFEAEYGPHFAEMRNLGGTEEGPPVQDSDALMLLMTFDQVQGLADTAIGETHGAVARVPEGGQEAAVDLVMQFQTSIEQTLGETMNLVNAAAGAAGQAGPVAWIAVNAARQALLDAEVTIRAARAHVMQQLEMLQTLTSSEDESRGGPEQATATA